MPQFFLLQKLPDGESAWGDEEGSKYSFRESLPNARTLCKNDVVLFYRPLRAGSPESGCIFATATVEAVVLEDGGKVDAHLRDYVVFQGPVPLREIGDPRRNSQHSFQRVNRSLFEAVMTANGGNEGGVG